MIITRSQWGALTPEKPSGPMRSIDAIVFHWGGVTLPPYTPQEAYARIRSVQRYHMLSRGWSDIGYNWLVDRHGQVFEGRGWNVVNAANGNTISNRTMPAICYIDGPGNPFTDAAKTAICTEILPLYATKRYLTHNDVRSLGPTACPGPEITAWVRAGCPNPKQERITPMFDPPIVIHAVAEATCPTGGVWVLGADGSIYAFGGAPYRGGMNPGTPYASHFEGRRAARLEPSGHPRGGPGYVIIATSGERYGPDFGV